jgi:hypothetical protein
MNKKKCMYGAFGIGLIVGAFVLLAYTNTNTRPETITVDASQSKYGLMSEAELADNYWLPFACDEVKRDVNCRLVEGIPEQPCRWLMTTYWLSPK